jgi:hypothetical protein
MQHGHHCGVPFHDAFLCNVLVCCLMLCVNFCLLARRRPLLIAALQLTTR